MHTVAHHQKLSSFFQEKKNRRGNDLRCMLKGMLTTPTISVKNVTEMLQKRS